MPKLKVLSGADVVKIFESFGFSIERQKGSHVKLKRAGAGGASETLTIPNHKELDRGTLRAIFRQGARYISEFELHPHFYTK